MTYVQTAKSKNLMLKKVKTLCRLGKKAERMSGETQGTRECTIW